MAKSEIWVLYDGKAGHLSQSRGLAERLASRIGAQVKIVQAYPRLGVLRLLALWAYRLGLVLPNLILFFYRFTLPQGKPKLIVSFGGKVVPLNVALARLLGCDNILIGNRYGVPARHFSVLVNAVDEGLSNQVVTQAPFSRTEKDVAIGDVERLAQLNQSSSPLWLLLLGGDGSGFSYCDQDWVQLKEAMIHLAEKHNIRWLVSSSRRTPQSGNALLSDPQLQASCYDMINYQTGGPGLGVFLQAAERIFVTADSLSMVTEAVSCDTSVPVIGLLPMAVSGQASVHQRTLRYYQQSQWLELLPIDRFSEYQPTYPTIPISYHQFLENTVTEILNQLSAPVQTGGKAGSHCHG